MKTYEFWIKRKHGSPYESITVQAVDASTAVNLLPQCVVWDFKQTTRR